MRCQRTGTALKILFFISSLPILLFSTCNDVSFVASLITWRGPSFLFYCNVESIWFKLLKTNYLSNNKFIYINSESFKQINNTLLSLLNNRWRFVRAFHVYIYINQKRLKFACTLACVTTTYTKTLVNHIFCNDDDIRLQKHTVNHLWNSLEQFFKLLS